MVVCLGFTGHAVAWADRARSAAYVEDPLAPHETSGSTVRLGTAVGFLFGERLDTTALGLTIGAGQRFGRLAIEAEFAYLELTARGPSNIRLGDAHRLGAVARFELIRLGSHIVGPNSMVSFYAEGGGGVAWNDWYLPQPGEPGRVVPGDTKRVEALAGFGILVDHRLQEPIGFPHRIGWYLGWRIAMSPHATEPASVCRGVVCRPAPEMEHARFTDRSMLFQSSLSVTW